MNWATITIAYNEEKRIGKALQNRIDAGYDTNLVMLSEKPFYGKTYPKDKTEDIALEMGADVIKGTWAQDDPMLNQGLQVLKGFDRVLFLAPDEFLTQKDHRKLRAFVEDNYYSPAFAASTMNTYFKEKQWRIEPRENYHPIIVVDPNRTAYTDIRSVVTGYSMLPSNVVLHHYSWVRTDAEVRRKLENFSHAPQITPNWYEDVWLKWTPEWNDFHPMNPHQYHSVVHDPPPEDFL